MGCGERGEGEETTNAGNCPVFYWIDIDGNGKIDDPWDISSPKGYYSGTAGPYMNEGQCFIPDTSDNPFAGKCVGEECSIPN